MRSKLFVPGSRPELFAKAFAGPADAISLDLEDSVSASQKSEARANVFDWLERIDRQPSLRNGKTVIVRINACDSPAHEADLDACVHPAVDILNLPKPSSPDQVREVSASISIRESRQTRSPQHTGSERLPAIGLLLNVETPRALRLAADLASADSRVCGLQLGLADLFEPAGIARGERAAIEQAMFMTRLAAAEAGVYAYDAAFSNIRDSEGFQAEAQLARRMGFIGKSCIHPSQVVLANAAFMPTDDEVAQARRIVEAAAEAERQGQGVCVVDGKMIDAPFIERARTILASVAPGGKSAPAGSD